MVDQPSKAPAASRVCVIRTLFATGACCLLLVGAAQGGPSRARLLSDQQSALWLISACEAASYPSHLPNVDLTLSDARFVAQGWRWSPGSTAWVAVLVRVDSLNTIALSRIGGLYGP